MNPVKEKDLNFKGKTNYHKLGPGKLNQIVSNPSILSRFTPQVYAQCKPPDIVKVLSFIS